MKALVTIISILFFLVGCQSIPPNVMITPDMVSYLGPKPEWTQQVETNNTSGIVKTKDKYYVEWTQPVETNNTLGIVKTKYKYYVETLLLEIIYLADVEAQNTNRYTKIVDEFEFDVDNFIKTLDVGDVLGFPSEILDLNILASPSICINQGQVGNIKSGQIYPYLSQKDKVSLIELGINQYIRVNNNQDDKILDVDIFTEFSSIDRYEKDQQGDLKPIVEMDRIGSSVQISPGQSVIFGGVIRDGNKKCIERIRYLSSIPLAGDLFTYNKIKPVKKELILITKTRAIE